MRHDLIERARRGDREAFGLIAVQDIDRLHAVARLILRDSQLAEDAVQEALVRAWRRLPKLRDVANYDAWMYRILVNAAADEVGRRRRFTASVQNLHLEPSVADDARGIADREQLERAFGRLSVDHRAVVVLHHYADLALPQVALALGIKPGTAKSRYHYAMEAMRAALEADARLVPVEEASA